MQGVQRQDIIRITLDRRPNTNDGILTEAKAVECRTTANTLFIGIEQ